VTRSIVVVDDDEDVRRLLVLSLSRVGGHDVRAVGSGEACLAEIHREMPDAVVLDVMMPVMDGPATLAEIRVDPQAFDVPVVFLTAGIVDSDVERLRTLPVSGVLHKPFDPIRLPAQLAELLGW
jgi:CheY-like chemotaxis protein